MWLTCFLHETFFPEYIWCAVEGKHMSVVKSAEHSRATEEITFLAGSSGEWRNVALIFLSGVSTLQGHFLQHRCLTSPPKAEVSNSRGEASQAFKRWRVVEFTILRSAFLIQTETWDGSWGLFHDLPCYRWDWKSPLQLLASSFVLICYERWLPGENMVARKQ